MRFVFRMLWRETRTSWGRLVFFFLCVGLGVASIVVLRSVVQHVRTTLTQEARSLIAADIVLQSQRPFDEDVLAVVDAVASGHVEATTDVVNTQTMASPMEGEGNGNVKLVELRGVEAAFPFYGRIDLLQGGPWSHDLLAGRGVVVQPELLVALDLQLGDRLRLGGQTFTVRGVIGRDRVQGGTGIAFGPRAYVDLSDLRATSLLGVGSRVGYQHLLRLAPDAPVEALTDRLRDGLRERFVSARSWKRLEDRIGRNLTIAENYLSLVGFAIVVLGGLGVWSVTRVIVQQKIRSIAILKCIGASGPSVLAIYLLQVMLLAAGGSALGLGLAWAAVSAIPASLIEPLGVSSVGVTASAAVQGLAVGLLVSLLFGLVPLLDIRAVKPLLLLRADAAGTARRRDWRSWVAALAIGAALMLVAVWQADSFEAGAYVSLGLGAVTAALYGGSLLVVRLTRPLVRSPRFALRHAVLGLSRPGNQTRVVLLSVGLGCFFIVGVRAIQGSLLNELSTQVGEQSPDLVLIDIQSDQVEDVKALVRPYLRGTARITPLMRGRVAAVDGSRLHLPTVEAVRDERDLRREFGLTFRLGLESNEQLVAGSTWERPITAETAGPGPADTEVTVEERLFEETDLSLGDLITFDIAGSVLRARITGVRSVDWEDSQNGGFVFVLRPAPAVERAAHNYVGFLQVIDNPQQRGALQRELVRALPNVSVIDVRDVIASIREIVDNVTLGVTIVGAVTLVGGVLILVGAVAMTKFQRLYETAIYRTLGASTRVVATTMAVEYGVLGTLAGVLGTAGGLLLSWALARFLFEIEWEVSGALFAAGVIGTGVTVAVVGVAASLDVLRRKPLATLRSE